MIGAPDFTIVTEIGRTRVSAEQLDRACHRYHWAARESAGKDVLEVACGSGLGLGLLRAKANYLEAGDHSQTLLVEAASNYAGAIPLKLMDAENLPFTDSSFDVVIMFEAIYYVDAKKFLAEARRVLRPSGFVLLVTANCALPDFNPSPFSGRYFDSVALGKLFSASGFEPVIAGYVNVSRVSLRQKVLQPVKRAAVAMGIIPKTMRSKEWMKRIFFGRLVNMPCDLQSVNYEFCMPTLLDTTKVDRVHKVIYCKATKLE
jgi:ubiquinone/menaquinone biosynthesis C-methylase UbiE